MGRQVRRVPHDWVHPEYQPWTGKSGFRPMDEKYQQRHDEFMAMLAQDGLQAALDYFGCAPDKNDYMPEWPEAECTHYMMYEDTSEGTPISPAFERPEELAQSLVDNNASAFGSSTASYEAWLRIAKGGWAPSAIMTGGEMISGVEALRND